MNTADDALHRCPLCEREVPVVSDHHLVPRSRGGAHADKLAICLDCHNAIHAMFTNKQLERELSTVEALREHESFAKHLRWLSKQNPARRFRSRRSRERH